MKYIFMVQLHKVIYLTITYRKGVNEMANTVDKQERMLTIHSLIGVGIMIFFRYLPISLPEVTPVGMEVLGIFLGTLYLWTFADPIWGSILSIGMLGFSHYGTMNEVLAQAFGAPVTVQVLFMLIMSGGLAYYKISAYLGRFFLTRKFTNGKPWLFLGVLCAGCYFIAGFINAFTPIFVLWPVLYGIFDDVGYKKGDAFPRVALTMIVIASLIGFPMAPFAQNGLALLSNFEKITAEMPGGPIVVNSGAYLATAIILGMIMIAVAILFCKFVLRPDVSKMKNFNVETFAKNPLPPMSLQQKLYCAGFVLVILGLMLPSLFPTLPLMSTLKPAVYGITMTVAALMAAIHIKGQPILDIPKVLANNVSWGSYFIIMAAVFLGSVLTNPSTGVSAFLSVVLSPIFQGMSPVVFIVLILGLGAFLTNICNSLVIGMILQPIIMTYSIQTGADARPIVTLMIQFVLLSAAVTPAASPFAAILHSNKEWIPTKYVYQYTLPIVLLEMAIMLLVGIPLTSILM